MSGVNIQKMSGKRGRADEYEHINEALGHENAKISKIIERIQEDSGIIMPKRKPPRTQKRGGKRVSKKHRKSRKHRRPL